MNRYPNAGSSAWMSMLAFVTCASSHSRSDIDCFNHLENAWVEKPSTSQVTTTGTPLAARSRTSGISLLGRDRQRNTPQLGASVLLLETTSSSAELHELFLLSSREPVNDTIVDVGLGHPALQRRHRDVEIVSCLAEGRVAPTSNRDNVTLELRWELLRDVNILPADYRSALEMSTKPAAVPLTIHQSRERALSGNVRNCQSV